MNEDSDFAFHLLDYVRASTPATFSGLGLIFYIAPLRLPVVSLGDQALFRPTLPVRGARAIADVLTFISQADSPWHDGFHLVDIDAGELTHVCQFFAPPLELLRASKPSAMPIGARYLAAVAGSRIESVACTALLGNQGDQLVFRRGTAVARRATT